MTQLLRITQTYKFPLQVAVFNGWLDRNRARILDLHAIACQPDGAAGGHPVAARSIIEAGGGKTAVLDCAVGTDSMRLLRAGLLTDYLPVIIVIASILTVMAVGLGVLIYYRTELRVWVFSQGWKLMSCCHCQGLGQRATRLPD